MSGDFALPFTVDQFYGVFAQYNEGVWPMQIVLYAIAISSLILLPQPRPAASRIIAGLLAALWVWMALTYCFLYLTRISVSGWIIGALLLTGGVWLGWVGGIEGGIRFGWRRDLQGAIGGLLVVYALAVYPLIGLAVGHRYPAMPTFGLPCPVTIFTVGMLLFTTSPVPRSVFVVPAAWGLLGGASATLLLGVYQDAGLVAAGFIGLLAMLAGTRPMSTGGRRSRQSRTTRGPSSLLRRLGFSSF
jgi:hypothetical protein